MEKDITINTIPDMTIEIGENYHLHFLDEAAHYDDLLSKKLVIGFFLSMVCALNIVLIHYRYELSIIQFFLLLVLLLPMNILWVRNNYQSFLYAFKILGFEKKAEVILREFPEIKNMIEEKCRDDVIFHYVYRSYRSLNLYFSSFLLLSGVFPLIISFAYCLHLLNIDDLTLSLYVLYFTILLYFSIFLWFWKVKKG